MIINLSILMGAPLVNIIQAAALAHQPFFTGFPIEIHSQFSEPSNPESDLQWPWEKLELFLDNFNGIPLQKKGTRAALGVWDKHMAVSFL